MKRAWGLGFAVGLLLLVDPAVGWAMGRAHKERAGAELADQEHAGEASVTHEHAGQTQEHDGQEHGGQEHAGVSAATATQAGQPVAQAEPSAEQIRQTIRSHIELYERENGGFTIHDELTGSERTLKLVQVHERVGKTDQLYYACTDMRDEQTGELLDLDFDVSAERGEPSVVDVRIHKVNDRPRYTYDEQDHRIPLTPGT